MSDHGAAAQEPPSPVPAPPPGAPSGGGTPPDRDRLGPWRGALLIALSIACLAALTWRKLPDPVVDYGREAYVAWRLAEGATFGEEVTTLYGPLSTHFNALCLRLGGVSLRTLFIADLAVFVALVVLVCGLVRPVLGGDAATLVGFVLVALCGFASYSNTAGWAWAAPYSHEATHGLLLAVLSLTLLVRHARTGGLASAAGAGVAWALTVVTKPEPAAAATAVLVTFFALLWRSAPALGLAPARSGAAVAVGAAITFVSMVGLLLARGLELEAALGATFGAWTSIVRAKVGSQVYFRNVTGLNEPLSHIGIILGSTAGFAALVGVAAAAGRAAGNRVADAAVGLVIAAGFVVLLTHPDWIMFEYAVRHYPITIPALTAILVWRAHRASPDRAAALEALPAALGAVLSLALLPKLGLRVTLAYYGFTLALPATALTVAALWVLAERMPARFGGGPTFRRLVLVGVLVLAAFHVRATLTNCEEKTFAVGHGADRIETTPGRGAPLAAALARIEEVVPTDGTVVVFPEGALLNFMTRRRTPLRNVSVLPTDLTMFGEDSYLSILKAAPPELIVLIDRDVTSYGAGRFGEDPLYGAGIMAWVRSEYPLVELFPTEPGPIKTSGGVTIFRRAPR